MLLLVGAVALALGVVVVFRAATRAVAGVAPASSALPAVLTLGLFATVPMWLGAPFDDLRVGVLGLVALCAPLAWRAPPARRPPPGVAPAFAFAALLFGPIIFWRHMFDEAPCHRPLTAAMARGVLPGEHPGFSGDRFVYHLGFDVLAGEVSAFCDVSASLAMDVVSVALLFVVLWTLADVLGALLGRAARATEVALGVLAHSPLALWGQAVYGVTPPGAAALFPTFQDPNVAMPPVASTFFQHPQALGLPISLTALIVAAAPDSARARVVLALLCASLAEAHAVFFAITGLLVGADALLRARPLGDRALRALWLGCALFASLLFGGLSVGHANALELGGFFETPGRTAIGFVLHLAVPTAVLALAAVRVARGRASPLEQLLAGGVAVGLAVASVIHYPASWDIVKFYQLATLLAAPLAVRALADLLPSRGARAAAFALLGVTSLVWLVRFGPLNGALGLPFHDEPPAHPVAALVAPPLAEHVGARDVVVTSAAVISDEGFLVFGADPVLQGAGFVIDRVSFAADRDLLALVLEKPTPRLLRATHARFAFLPAPMLHERTAAADARAVEEAAATTVLIEGLPWLLVDLHRLAPR